MGPTSTKKKKKVFCLSEIPVLLGALLCIWQLEPKVTQQQVQCWAVSRAPSCRAPAPLTAAVGAGRVLNGGRTNQMPGNHWEEERKIGNGHGCKFQFRSYDPHRPPGTSSESPS